MILAKYNLISNDKDDIKDILEKSKLLVGTMFKVTNILNENNTLFIVTDTWTLHIFKA